MVNSTVPCVCSTDWLYESYWLTGWLQPGIMSQEQVVSELLHHLCQRQSPLSQQWIAGGWQGPRQHWSISCPPLGSLIETFGWPHLFVLVKCGGLLFCFFPPQCCCSKDFWVNRVAMVTLSSSTSLSPVCSQSAPLGSFLPADSLAGPLTTEPLG